MATSWKLWVGVDWASKEHQVCVLDRDGKVVGERCVKNHGEGLEALVSWLVSHHSNPAAIAVAIEVPHGAIVETLMDREFAVFAINPKQLDRFRDRFSPAGAKDDRRDARVLASSLRTDERSFRQLEARSAWAIELREFSRIHDELKIEQGRLVNRMREQLQRYFVAFLALGDPGEKWLLALWKRARTPQEARRLKAPTVAKLLRQHRIRRLDAAAVLTTLRAQPLKLSEATVNAATSHIALLVPAIELVTQQIRDVDRHLEQLLLGGEDGSHEGEWSEQRDAQIVLSCPGVGTIVAATLLSEAPDLLRDRDYQGLRKHSGIAPVTKRSGRSIQVHIRYACSPRLRNALYHWARVAMQCEPRSKERYAALRARGHSHGRALRTLADRLLAMLCAMLRNDSEYQPNHVAPRDKEA